MHVVNIRRFAVKGLSGDALASCELADRDGLPDDRRFALIFQRCVHLLKENEWLHKENFGCAFTSGLPLSTLRTSYDEETSRLTVYRRGTRKPLLEAKLSDAQGRDDAGQFFSDVVGEPVLVADGADTHQFGNTSKGVKASGDLRTVHIVNAATVRALSAKTGVAIDPLRFRANLIIDGLSAWDEAAWVGRRLRVGRATLRVIARATRCAGVNLSSEVDGGSSGDDGSLLDVPGLLARDFPEQAPYLGVYAQVEAGGWVSVGDQVELAPVRVPSKWAAAARAWLQRVGLGRLAACEDPTVGVLCAGLVLIIAGVHAAGWLLAGGKKS